MQKLLKLNPKLTNDKQEEEQWAQQQQSRFVDVALAVNYLILSIHMQIPALFRQKWPLLDFNI